MKSLCQTCNNIFDYPKCCTQNPADGIGIMTSCKNYTPGFGAEKTIEKNPTYQIRQEIFFAVADTQDKACIDAIKAWAKEKGYDDVLLMDESKLKEVVALGSAEYKRLCGGD